MSLFGDLPPAAGDGQRRGFVPQAVVKRESDAATAAEDELTALLRGLLVGRGGGVGGLGAQKGPAWPSMAPGPRARWVAVLRR
jgi:hypothetical protein